MNARFWVWVNGGWVKLTLRPNHDFQWATGGVADEGYSFTAEQWTHVGDGVEWESHTWGRDCDGRHESNCDVFCALDKLASVAITEPREGDPPALPNWVRLRSGQRDYTAEACGY